MARSSEPSIHRLHIRRGQLLYLGLFVLLAYVVLPQISVFRRSWPALNVVRWPWVLLALAAMLITFAASAAVYCLLAWRRLSFGRTLLVELAANFANRLLPAGIGNLGANYAYLRHSRHTRPEALSVLAVNNGLGFVGHLLLFASLILTGQSIGRLHISLPTVRGSWAVFGGLCVAAWLLWWLRRRTAKLLGGFISRLLAYRRRPNALLLALVGSVAITGGNILALWYSALSLHISLGLLPLLLIFTVAVTAGTVTPTPGGLGGFEAGLVAGFIAYQVADSRALAIVLIYRLINFWLPFAAGAAAFAVANRRGYFSSKY